LKLFERVGDEIGKSLHKSVAQYEIEIKEETYKNSSLNANELEI